MTLHRASSGGCCKKTRELEQMDEATNQSGAPATVPTDAQPERYRHEDATRIVPTQRDHLGWPFCESYWTTMAEERSRANAKQIEWGKVNDA
jgi:hypothetical protein